tara:strand:+ start:820 stop:1215 length:396 start_codon:yes stop_codon:yes gene_type:complete
MYGVLKHNTPYIVCFENKADSKHIVKSLTIYHSIHKRLPVNKDIYICRPTDIEKWDTSKHKQVQYGLFDEEMHLIDLFKMTEFRNIGISMISLDHQEDVNGFGISFVNFAPIDDLEKEKDCIDKLESDFLL